MDPFPLDFISLICILCSALLFPEGVLYCSKGSFCLYVTLCPQKQRGGGVDKGYRSGYTQTVSQLSFGVIPGYPNVSHEGGIGEVVMHELCVRRKKLVVLELWISWRV